MISNLPTYAPLNDLSKIFFQTDSLCEVDQLIEAVSLYRQKLEKEILFQLEETNEFEFEEDTQLDDFFKEINEIKVLSNSAKDNISRLTKDISYLDNAKHNLTHSISWFQNLQLLSECYINSKKYMESMDFISMCAPYKSLCSLREIFQNYKSIDEISKLVNATLLLELKTISNIKKLYQQTINSTPTSELQTMLREGAAELLIMNNEYKEEVINWYLENSLHEIKEIFQVSDEAGSLENLSRRYIYFKKLLSNFEKNLSPCFPEEWEMNLKLTLDFFKTTKSDLKILLKKEIKSNTSINLFMHSLQETLDFEKYINDKFSNKLKLDPSKKISMCFEPYLNIWISYQDKIMNSKMLTYLSDPKLPNPSESLVVPSSADLFRTYRSILRQTLELIERDGRENILISLTRFFSHWLIEYSNKILQPLLLPENAQISDRNEVMEYTMLLINTADYCSITVDQLEEKLIEYIKMKDQISNTFEKVKTLYGSMISKGINFLLYRIVRPELGFSWREFDNFDWDGIMVEGYSRYVISLKNILFPPSKTEKSTVDRILKQFNREIYNWTFIDRIADLLIKDFLSHVINLLCASPPYATLTNKRRLSPIQVAFIGQKLLLDSDLFKEILYRLPESISNESLSQKRFHDRFNRYVDKNMDQLIVLFNVLAAPMESVQEYTQKYCSIVGNCADSTIWSFIFVLKGMSWDLAEWKKFWSDFNSKCTNQDECTLVLIKTHNRLIDFNRTMSKINDQAWKKFIHEELNIESRYVSITNDLPIVSSDYCPKGQSQKTPTNKINENIKNLMIGSRFFGR